MVNSKNGIVFLIMFAFKESGRVVEASASSGVDLNAKKIDQEHL